MAAWVVRDREQYGEADVAVDGLHDHLSQVPRAAPQAPHLGAGTEKAAVVGIEPPNSQADRCDAVRVGIVPGERLTEDLCARVDTGRPNRYTGVDRLGGRIRADHLTGAREDHPADAGAARRLEDLIGTVDVDGHHAPGELMLLLVDSGEVHDRRHIATGPSQGRAIRNVGSDHFVVELRLNTLNIEKADREVLAQQRNDFTPIFPAAPVTRMRGRE
jgi:hypothetical protein